MDVLMKMIRFRCILLVLAVTLAFVDVSKSSAVPPTKVLTFMSMFSGEWTDQDQVDQDRTSSRRAHDRIVLFFIPILVLGEDCPYSFLGVEKLNDTVIRVRVMPVTEDPDGNIRMSSLNLTRMENFQFDPSNPPRVINFEPEELRELPRECDAVFVEIETNVFFGQWPDCRGRSPGIMPEYTNMLTCNKFLSTVPGTLENRRLLPYVFTHHTRCWKVLTTSLFRAPAVRLHSVLPALGENVANRQDVFRDWRIWRQCPDNYTN